MIQIYHLNNFWCQIISAAASINKHSVCDLMVLRNMGVDLRYDKKFGLKFHFTGIESADWNRKIYAFAMTDLFKFYPWMPGVMKAIGERYEMRREIKKV